MPNLYDVGDNPKITGAFTDISGSPVDPTTVTAIWKDPAGVETTLVYGVGNTIVKDSIGVYHFYILINQTGTYFYRWVGTGTNQVAEENHFTVRTSNL